MYVEMVFSLVLSFRALCACTYVLPAVGAIALSHLLEYRYTARNDAADLNTAAAILGEFSHDARVIGQLKALESQYPTILERHASESSRNNGP